MIGPARGGFFGIIIIVAVIYFTGAGSWALNNLKGLDSACYSGLARVGAQVANPACAALAKGLAAIDGFASSAGEKIERLQYSLFGGNGVDKLETIVLSLGDGVSDFVSSGAHLSQMMSAGPSSIAQSGRLPFQQAIDSFAIGSGLLKGGGTSQAIPWLQQGAQQPQGFGLMSQLALGNVYANGGQGVAANPQHAEYYLSQARQSIEMLSANNSQQSQQLLGSLPGSPQKVQADLQRMIIEIRSSPR